MKKLLIILLLQSLAFANQYDASDDVVAAWLFEPSAHTTDSHTGGGTAQTLSVGAAADNAAAWKQGSGAADFEATNNDYYYRANADIGTTFDGDLTIMLWFRPETINYNAQALIGISDQTTPAYEWTLESYHDDLRIWTGYNSGANESKELDLTNCLTEGHWHHIMAKIDRTSAPDHLYLRVIDVDDTPDSVYALDDDTAAAIYSGGSANLSIGVNQNGAEWVDGIIDEMVVFNTLKSNDDQDAMIAGTFGESGSSIPIIQYNRSQQ